MKYINKLTDEELRKLFGAFVGDAEVVSLKVIRNAEKIHLDGVIRIADPYGEGKKTDDIVEVDERYEVDDYEFTPNDWYDDEDILSATEKLRKTLYAKFGEAYAKDYLFADFAH